MLVEAAVGGTVISVGVSWVLVRYAERFPGGEPVSKALVLCFAVLLAVSVLIEVPGKVGASVDRPLHNLLIATTIYALRILALGLTVGVLLQRDGGGDHQGSR